jgi:hypothetical protein
VGLIALLFLQSKIKCIILSSGENKVPHYFRRKNQGPPYFFRKKSSQLLFLQKNKRLIISSEKKSSALLSIRNKNKHFCLEKL